MATSMNLREFKIPLGKLAPRETFRTRSEDELSYRMYPAWSEDLVVLYHGSGSDSRYMCALASAIAEKGIASVVTPDLRCHGASLGLSDQIAPSQLEIDLDELLIHIKMQRAVSRITLAGHSMGGGFALRISVSDMRHQFSKFIALAPHLPEKWNTQQPNYGGWIEKDADGFKVNFPEKFRTGKEKLHYSQAFLNAVHAPEDILERIKVIQPRLTAVTGLLDEVVDARRQEEVFREAGVPMIVVPDVNHLTVVSKVDGYISLF